MRQPNSEHPSPERSGAFKHLDFMLIDLLAMQLAFVLAYWLTVGLGNPYGALHYRTQAMVILMAQIAVTLFTGSYHGILRRGLIDELFAVIKYAVEVLVVALVYLFVTHQIASASRLLIGFTFAFFVVVALAVRRANRARVLRSGNDAKKSLVLVTSRALVPGAVARITDPAEYREHRLSGVIFLDGPAEPKAAPDVTAPINLPAAEAVETPAGGVAAVPYGPAALTRLARGWVDEVLVLQPAEMALPAGLMDGLAAMGLTVSLASDALGGGRWSFTGTGNVGGYDVLTSGARFASAGQLAAKRAMDIVGGLIGCLITGVLFVFVAPAIVAKSPGPVFFRQKRVGLNGRVFDMYKFRSMYLDAEERKAALAPENKVEGGLMFKMDDDPRVIGSERKGPDGRPRGIGNFIRRTSIDEFPQFFNVLKGDMSLVGTRPPTLEEWERYDLGHRARMSIKPGITGLWQVSGRSEITDFDEVVALDRKYIETWSLGLDVRILLKTVKVAFMRKGAA